MKKIILGILMMFFLASNAEAEAGNLFDQDVLDAAPTFADCSSVYDVYRAQIKDENKKKAALRLGRLNFKTAVYLFALDGYKKGDRPADREKAEKKASKILRKRNQGWAKVLITQGQKGKDFFNSVLADCNTNQEWRKLYLPKLEAIMEDRIIIQTGNKPPVEIPLGPTPFWKLK